MAFLKKIPSSFSDADLVQRYKSTGDAAVLGDLYSRYMELVYGVCLKYLKEPEDAQDAVMAIFEELLIKLQKHEVENFRSWLYTVAKNHCLMKLRSGKKAVVTKLPEEFMQSEDGLHLDGVLEKEENLKRLEACLERLSADQRTAVEAFYLRGKCYNQIAAETGMEWNKVRSFIQNGRRNLKICLETTQAQTVSK